MAVPLVEKASPLLRSVQSAVSSLALPRSTPASPLPLCSRRDVNHGDATMAAPAPRVWSDSRMRFTDADGVVYRAAGASRRQARRAAVAAGSAGAEAPSAVGVAPPLCP